MSKYFQIGLALSYVLLTSFAFLLMLRLSGLFISEAVGWSGIAGWILFCFSSFYFTTDIYGLVGGKLRRPILEEEERIQRCLREVLASASVDRNFRLMIKEEMALDVFAAGHQTFVLTRGILVQVTDDELKGVLAHELGHLISKDTIAASVFFTAGLLPRIAIHLYRRICRVMTKVIFPSVRVLTNRGSLKTGGIGWLQGIIILLLFGYLLYRMHLLQAVIPVISFVLLFSLLNSVFNFFYLMMSRFIEYKQDAYAYRLGYGPGLRQALKKLTADNEQPVNTFFIIFKSSHPVIYNRIRRMEKLEGLRA